MGGTHIWERQETETDKSFSAFCIYRDMGAERSLEKVVQKYNKSSTYKAQLGKWSSQHDWVARASAYDDYLEQQTRESLEQRIIDERQKIIDDELADYYLQLDIWRVKFELITNLKGSGTNYSDLQTLAKWRDDIAKQGRRALSLPDKYTHQRNEDLTPRDDDWDAIVQELANGSE